MIVVLSTRKHQHYNDSHAHYNLVKFRHLLILVEHASALSFRYMICITFVKFVGLLNRHILGILIDGCYIGLYVKDTLMRETKRCGSLLLSLLLWYIYVPIRRYFRFLSDEEKLSPINSPEWNLSNRLINLRSMQFPKPYKSSN